MFGVGGETGVWMLGVFFGLVSPFFIPILLCLLCIAFWYATMLTNFLVVFCLE